MLILASFFQFLFFQGLLPVSVLVELKEGRQLIADEFDQVSIMLTGTKREGEGRERGGRGEGEGRERGGRGEGEGRERGRGRERGGRGEGGREEGREGEGERG